MSVSFNKIQDLALSIPQIQQAIFQDGGLSSHDRTVAARVCRAWNIIVSPFLWNNVIIITDLNQNWSGGFISGLASQGEWTRAITTTSDLVLAWCSESPACTQLRVIDASHLYDYQSGRNAMTKLVSKNPALEVLRWRAGRFDDYQQLGDVCRELMKTSSKFLTTIDLAKVNLDNNFYQLLKHHSATMKHLALELCEVYSDTSCTFKEQRLKLKTLVTVWDEFYDATQLEFMDCFTSLIRITDELVEFTIATGYPVLLEQLPKLFAASKSSQEHDEPLALLETLNVQSSCGKLLRETTFVEFLDALPDSLSRLSLDGFLVKDSGNIALRNFARRNHDRLTSIKLVKCQAIANETWRTILTRCQYLKEIDGTGSSPLELRLGIKEPWVCLGLESFGLGLVNSRSLNQHLGNEIVDIMTAISTATFQDEEMLKNCEAFFTQLSTLTHLRRLSMVIVDAHERQNGLGLKRSELECRFLSIWSSLGTCTKMEEVDVWFSLPDMQRAETEMKKCSREMWGKKATIQIRMRTRAVMQARNKGLF